MSISGDKFRRRLFQEVTEKRKVYFSSTPDSQNTGLLYSRWKKWGGKIELVLLTSHVVDVDVKYGVSGIFVRIS